MPTCLLCKKNNANQTGSHIVPHFILKRIENVNNSPLRHKEVSFVIGEKFETFYVGNAVLPEQYEEVLGQLSDEEIVKLKNPSVHDHLFCTSCEDRFGAVESEYSKSISIFDNQPVYKSKNESGVAFLLWTSILWRLSISPSHKFKLVVDEEEQLRSLLDSYLKEKVNTIDFKALYGDKNYSDLGYQLMRSVNYSNDNATFLLFDPANTRPYSIIVDEFVLLFYFNSEESASPQFSFFGFETHIKETPINKTYSAESIHSLCVEQFKQGLLNVADRVAIQRLHFYDSMFDHIHVVMGGKGNKMPQFIKQNIITRIVNSEKEIGRKYNIDEITKIIYEEMSKFTG